MYWALVQESGQEKKTEGVSFDPSAVFRLSQLSKNLPWLGALDPYRDQRVIEGDFSAARRDFESVRTRNTSDFLADFARNKGIQVDDLQRRPHLLQVAMNHLKKDTFYQLLEKVIALLKTAEEQGGSVQVFGT
jgi:hypothetical protein